MKTALAVVFVAAGVTGIEKPDILNMWPDILNMWREAYPTDTVRAAALDRCGFENQTFNRLSGAEREACYQKMLPSAAPRMLPTAAATSQRASAVQVAPNAVDIARLAGTPQGDIRRQQATEQYRKAVRQ
jgi:hypothetical protein